MEFNTDWLDSIGNDYIQDDIEQYNAETKQPPSPNSRVGNFTSSEIYNLTTKDRSGKGFGKPALTYIEEKIMERLLGRRLDSESNAKPLVWGRFAEKIAFGLLGMTYTLCSQDTLTHSEIEHWRGTPDVLTSDTVGDIKCPFTLKSFCQLVLPLYRGLSGIDAMNEIRSNHKDGDKYYWQLVSNAVLTGKKYAELIVYCPYFSEIPKIRMAADGEPDAHFIQFAMDGELPYINDNGYFKNINVIRFEVPDEDKDFLTERVLTAVEMLENQQIPN